jgi:hypothetical protein
MFIRMPSFQGIAVHLQNVVRNSHRAWHFSTHSGIEEKEL